MADREVVKLLRGIRGELASIRRVLEVDAGLDPEEAAACPHCGSDRVEDTSTDRPRMTCLACGKSAPSEEEAVNG